MSQQNSTISTQSDLIEAVAMYPSNSNSSGLFLQRLENHILIPVTMQSQNQEYIQPSIYLTTETSQTVDEFSNFQDGRCYNLSDIIQQPTSSRLLTINPLQMCLPKTVKTYSKLQSEYEMKEPPDIMQVVVENITSFNSNNNESLVVQTKPTGVVKSVKKKAAIKIPKFVSIADRQAPPRALAVLPLALQHRNGVISPRRSLPPYVRFGPVEGIAERLSAAEVRHLVRECALAGRPVFLIKNDHDSFTHIDVSDQDKSNWIGLLGLGDHSTANVWLHQDGKHIYAVTKASIPARVGLSLGYVKEYADQLRLPEGQPFVDLEEEINEGPSPWRCEECAIELPSLFDLERHNNATHSEEKKRPRNRYRCRHCAKKFTRIFCLKRHLLLNCSKRKTSNENSPDTTLNNGTAKIQDGVSSHENSVELDGKLPSDESLQNYTNILDFSTNLFDTDRIPNLDISGSSKSDNDFNFYGLKDDNRLMHSFDLADEVRKIGGEVDTNMSNFKKTDNRKKPSPFTCSYCKQSVQRSRIRQHARLCESRRFECHCGRAFRSKDQLGRHVFRTHRGTSTPLQNKESDETEVPKDEADITYKCVHCSLVFKRRGMLVNHLSRAHDVTSAATSAIPLIKQEKRYPCPACPKLYTAAAKRDSHVAVHHPGITYNKWSWIPGGRRRVPAAACWACARQFASRAKLLQHARAAHPHQAPPASKTKKTTTTNTQ